MIEKRIAEYAGFALDERAEKNAEKFCEKDKSAFERLFAEIDADNSRRRIIASIIEEGGLSDAEIICIYPLLTNGWRALALQQYRPLLEKEAAQRGLVLKDPNPAWWEYYPATQRTPYGTGKISGGHFRPRLV